MNAILPWPFRPSLSPTYISFHTPFNRGCHNSHSHHSLYCQGNLSLIFKARIHGRVGQTLKYLYKFTSKMTLWFLWLLWQPLKKRVINRNDSWSQWIPNGLWEYGIHGRVTQALNVLMFSLKISLRLLWLLWQPLQKGVVNRNISCRQWNASWVIAGWHSW